ncbi:MAG: chemotaxis protein CheW [Vicinamibacterales bacterium]
MTALLFEAARQRYALDVSSIIEVIPAVRLRTLTGVPACVAGVLRYRGAVVPVIDVNQVLTGQPARPSFSTRLVIVRYSAVSGTERPLGLLLERASRGVASNVGELVSTGIATTDAPYLGPLAAAGAESVQFVNPGELVPPDVRDRLFAES